MAGQVLREPAQAQSKPPSPSAPKTQMPAPVYCSCTAPEPRHGMLLHPIPSRPPNHLSPLQNLTGVGSKPLGPGDPALSSQIRQYYKGFVSLMNNAELNYIRSGLNFHIPISHLHKEFPLAASWGCLCQLRDAPNEIIPSAGEVGFGAARPLGEKVKSQSSNYLSP